MHWRVGIEFQAHTENEAVEYASTTRDNKIEAPSNQGSAGAVSSQPHLPPADNEQCPQQLEDSPGCEPDSQQLEGLRVTSEVSSSRLRDDVCDTESNRASVHIEPIVCDEGVQNH
ncbi:hypothetical protein V6N12_019530 [Hibiscus sabdariffa]|uniref:Uncharacterized protein n=1 Tax=Hibiscus sabdariffa TaxID=183260 RepID=A0ABR2BMI2_9ROSI